MASIETNASTPKITSVSGYVMETQFFKYTILPIFRAIRPSSQAWERIKEISPRWIGEDGRINIYLLFALQLINSIILFYNLLSIPFIIAFESYWHIALHIVNIVTDILYFFSILILEGRFIVFFLLFLFGKRFLKLMDKFAYTICSFRCSSFLGKLRESHLNRKRCRVSQHHDSNTIQHSQPPQRGGRVSPPPSNASRATKAEPKPSENEAGKVEPKSEIIITDLLSKEFKDDFFLYWEIYLRKFFRNYLFTLKFLADLIMFFFIDWFFVNVPWLRIGKFVAAAIRFNSQLDSVLKKLNIRSSTERVVRLLFLLLSLFHVFACIFYFISSMRGERYEVGIIPAEVLKLPLLRNACMSRSISPEYNFTDRVKQYSCSLHFAMVFLVGYHDVSPPQGFYQALYCVAYVLAGSLLFATMIGTVSALIQTRDVTGIMYQEKIENVKGFMRERKISHRVRRNVSRYYEILRNTRRDMPAREVFSDLDLDLYRNITQSLYKDLLMGIDLFKKCNNDFFISDVCQILDYILLLDGFDILQEEDVGMTMYFIHSGKVKVYHMNEDGTETELAILGPGSLIGELAIVNVTQLRNASCRPVTSIVELISLQFSSFFNVLERYPDCKTIIYDGLMERNRKILKRNAIMLKKARFQKQKRSTSKSSFTLRNSFRSQNKIHPKDSGRDTRDSEEKLIDPNLNDLNDLKLSPIEKIASTANRRRSNSAVYRIRHPNLLNKSSHATSITEKRNVKPLSIVVPKSDSPRQNIIESQPISGLTPLLGNLNQANNSPLATSNEQDTLQKIATKLAEDTMKQALEERKSAVDNQKVDTVQATESSNMPTPETDTQKLQSSENVPEPNIPFNSAKKSDNSSTIDSRSKNEKKEEDIPRISLIPDVLDMSETESNRNNNFNPMQAESPSTPIIGGGYLSPASASLSSSGISPISNQRSSDDKLDEIRRIMGIQSPKSPQSMIVKRQSRRIYPDMVEEISRTSIRNSIGLNDSSPSNTSVNTTQATFNLIPQRPRKLTLPPVSPTRTPPSPHYTRRSLVLSNSLLSDNSQDEEETSKQSDKEDT